jgi:hypothetical protein
MGEWRDCWPPNEPPKTRIRAAIKIPLRVGIYSYWMVAEDTAEAFTEFMAASQQPAHDEFKADVLPLPTNAPLVGGTWSGQADDFTVTR